MKHFLFEMGLKPIQAHTMQYIIPSRPKLSSTRTGGLKLQCPGCQNSSYLEQTRWVLIKWVQCLEMPILKD
jgi:hypothetical protein